MGSFILITPYFRPHGPLDSEVFSDYIIHIFQFTFPSPPLPARPAPLTSLTFCPLPNWM